MSPWDERINVYIQRVGGGGEGGEEERSVLGDPGAGGRGRQSGQSGEDWGRIGGGGERRGYRGGISQEENYTGLSCTGCKGRYQNSPLRATNCFREM